MAGILHKKYLDSNYLEQAGRLQKTRTQIFYGGEFRVVEKLGYSKDDFAHSFTFKFVKY